MSWPVLLISPYFFVALLIFGGLLRSWRISKESDRANSSKYNTSDKSTLITVICPFRNEEHKLPFLLHDLEKQDYPPDLTQIILVDDHSEDNSVKVANDLCSGWKNTSIIKSGKSGKKQSFNTAFNTASGELIITTDADCRVSTGWLSSIENLYRNEKADLILGPVTLFDSGSLLHQPLLLEFLSIQAVARGSFFLNHPVLASGANLAFSRKLSENYIDYIKPEIPSGDDMFMLHHAIKKRMKISYNNNPGGLVKTIGESSFSGFLRQRSRWAGKIFNYNDFGTIAGGIIVASASLAIVTFLVISLFIHQLFPAVLLMYLIKGAADFLILYSYLLTQKQLRLLRWFTAVEILYPFYVATVLLWAITGASGWRGRS